MITAQDKILHVASKLGLSSLQNMQASTGAVYDVDTDLAGQIFSSASRHQNPSVTNLNDNQFEVNEALLIESIAFYTFDAANGNVQNFQRTYGSNAMITFDVKIGNKVVMKDTPIFGGGMPYTFSNIGITDIAAENIYIPRHQVFLEGAGILIPPQVQFSVDYRVFNIITGAPIASTSTTAVGCYLFGTKVLLNFNTSI